MISQNYQLIIPDEKQHLLRMGTLTADVFSGGNYVEAFCQNYIGNSHYDWHTSRLVQDGEKLIHHWGVWGYQMRVEEIELKVGGIGAVATHPDYRKQGVMHQAAEASFDAMRADGFDLSILRGRHYVKMGYARAWNYVTYRLNVEDLHEPRLLSPYQALGVERVAEMDSLYNQTHAAFSGTAIRPTFRNRHPEDMGVYAWFDAHGKLEGYIRALPAEEEPKKLQCLEAAGDVQQALAVLVDVFKRGGYENLVCFTIPHHHPLLQQVRKGACIVEDRYFDVSGWRVRIINLKSTLTKLIPLFEQRLAGSAFAGWRGNLLIDAGDQQAVLRLEKGKVGIDGDGASENHLRGGAAISRFLIGSDEPEEIIRQADMDCTPKAVALARVLFPNLHPMMSHWDEY